MATPTDLDLGKEWGVDKLEKESDRHCATSVSRCKYNATPCHCDAKRGKSCKPLFSSSSYPPLWPPFHPAAIWGERLPRFKGSVLFFSGKISVIRSWSTIVQSNFPPVSQFVCMSPCGQAIMVWMRVGPHPKLPYKTKSNRDL